MTVPGQPLEVRVELEVVDGVLVVAFHETDRRHPLAEDAEDAERDLVLVGAHHLNAPAVRLEHGRVVDAHPERVGHGGLLVGVHGAHPQVGVAAAQDLDQVPRALSRRVLRLIEVGQRHVLPQRVDDVLRLPRRREDLLARQVEVHVVKHERDVGERGDAHDPDHDRGRIAECRQAPEAWLQRQPDGHGEEPEEGGEPSQEPQRIDEVEPAHARPTVAPACAR